MKYISTLLLILIINLSHAKTWTVNNNNPSPGQYTTIQAAVDAALAGDTILVSGSPTSYGNTNLNKGLTILGTGWNPKKDFPLKSTIDNFYFLSGSSNTTIAGFICTNTLIRDGGLIAPISNIVIKRNYTYDLGGLTTKMSSLTFEQNVASYLEINDADNVVINNNIITGYISYSTKTSIIIQNNFFSYNGNAFNGIYNALITDNIFYRANPLGCSACVFNNNLTYNSTPGTFPPDPISGKPANTANSLNIVNKDPQFAYVPDLSIDINTSASYNFRLQPSSPAINKGTNGTDIGPTGGKSPIYIDAKSILGADVYTPQIKSMQLNVSSIPQGGSFNVTIKAKKQN